MVLRRLRRTPLSDEDWAVRVLTGAAAPSAELQALFNGASGRDLALQGAAFVRVLRARLGVGPGARVLDFGCGWGRLLRVLSREGWELYGCDPVQGALDLCAGLDAELARSDFVPRELPFPGVAFDGAYAFSVFTHLSETAHRACLRALHAGLRPGARLVATVRPPDYLREHPALLPFADDPPPYAFAPHPVEGHLQHEPGAPMHFGDTVVSLDYVRERWTGFALEHTDTMPEDPFQLVLTLRRGE